MPTLSEPERPGPHGRDGSAPRFSCVLCGKEEHEVLFPSRDRRHGVEGAYVLVRCLSCRLVAVHPQPDPETLLRHYPEDYYTHRPPSPTVKDRLRGAGRMLLFRAWAGRLEERRSGPGSLLHAVLDRVPSARDTAQRLGYDAMVPGRGRRLLGIGFGDASFLDFAARHGFRTSGVDFDPVAVESARQRGHEVKRGGVVDAGFDADTFDFVRMRHVLEHVRDPAATLAEVFRILRAGGWLHVEVPNFDSLYAQAFGERWAQIEAPRHLYHFTETTLGRLLGESGFQVCRTQFDTQPWHLLGSLRHVTADLRPGKEGWVDDGRLSSSLYRLSRAVTAAGMGDNLIVLARKRAPGGATP